MPADTFDAAWAHAQHVDGWLTEAQARVLFAEAQRATGPVVEIGSHLGRSTVVLAASGARVVAVDPFPPDWRYGTRDTEARFRANLDAAGVADAVTVLVRTSTAALEGWSGPVGLVFVDGKHDVWSCLRDLRWTRHLDPGARFLVHDAFSSVGVTAAMLVLAVATRRSRYVGRTGSLALFERAPASPADRLRVLGEMPWFARNLVVKVLLRLRQRRVAAALGHRDLADPY